MCSTFTDSLPHAASSLATVKTSDSRERRGEPHCGQVGGWGLEREFKSHVPKQEVNRKCLKWNNQDRIIQHVTDLEGKHKTIT